MATVKTLIGNVKGPQGDKGDQGLQGEKGVKGDTGQRGSRWVSGGAITGTSTTDTVFSGTGITDALVNDQYLNPRTGHVYRCTKAGDADTATWVWTGNINSGTTVDLDIPGIGNWNVGDTNEFNENEYDLLDVCYGGGRYVAVGENGGVYYSKDGITWHTGAGVSSSIGKLVAVAYDEGWKRFVAVGDGDKTYTSSDGGETWWAGSSGLNSWRDICYGNGMFMAVGSNGIFGSEQSILLEESVDKEGITKVDKSTYNFLKPTTGWYSKHYLYSIAYGNGVYVALTHYMSADDTGENGKAFIYRSKDGISFSLRTTIPGALLTNVTYCNGMFIAVGDFYTTSVDTEGVLYYSTDGITWSKGNFDDVQATLISSTYGNGVFIAVDILRYIYQSENGVDWTRLTDNELIDSMRHINSITRGNGLFVAVGDGGNAHYAEDTKEIRDLGDVVTELDNKIDSSYAELDNKLDSSYAELDNKLDSSYAEHAKEIRDLGDVVTELDNNKLDSSYAKQLFVQNDSSGKHGLHLYYDEATRGLCAKVDVTDFGALVFQSNLSDLEILIRRLNTAVYELQSVNNTVTSGIILYNVKTNVAQHDRLRKQGRIVQISSMFVPSEDIPADTTFATLPAVFKPCMDTPIVVTRAATVEAYYCLICTDGSIKIPNISMPGGYYYNIYATFISAV